MSIPIIDFEKLMANDPEMQARLRHGVSEVGFLVIENTPIDTKKIHSVIAVYRRFFHLPDNKKAPYDMAQTGSNRGWGRSKGEQVNPKANPDYKEIFDSGVELPRNHPMRNITYYAPNLWPSDSNFKTQIINYYNAAFGISIQLLAAITHAADLPENFFDDKFDPPMALLRANYYPPRPADASTKDFGIAEHTDYGCLTLLATDGVPGLEAKMSDGSWVGVIAKPGQFVINFGEMLESWSGGKIRATLHRVIGSNKERISVPFFFNPAYETNVAPTRSDEIIKAGDYLSKRYDETYLHRKTSTT